MKLGFKLTPDTKVEPTQKLTEGDIGEKLCDITLGKDFLYMTSISQSTKAKTDKSDCTRLKASLQQSINRVKT